VHAISTHHLHHSQPAHAHCCGNTLPVDHAAGRAHCDRSRSPGQTHRERECHARKPHEAIVGDGQEGQSSHDRCEPGHRWPSCNLLIDRSHLCMVHVVASAEMHVRAAPLHQVIHSMIHLRYSPCIALEHGAAHLVFSTVSTHDRSVCMPTRTCACHAIAHTHP
jgi:hypothetical protein